MKEDIEETEIRIIGKETNEKNPVPPAKNRWWWLVVIAAAMAVLIVFAIKEKDDEEKKEVEENVIVEGEDMKEVTAFENETLLPLLESTARMGDTTTFVVDTTINDVPLTIYIPTHQTPALAVGYDILSDTAEISLMFQAADVRGDTEKIAGDFVLGGNDMAKRKTRNGYCRIIGNEVRIGTDTTDSNKKEAIDKKGDFFRQYALVDSGKVVPNKITKESKRRGLCQIGSYTFVAESKTEITFDRFSETLVALGVENAIYLLGSRSKTWCRSEKNVVTKQGDWQNREYENANFIVWRR